VCSSFSHFRFENTYCPVSPRTVSGSHYDKTRTVPLSRRNRSRALATKGLVVGAEKGAWTRDSRRKKMEARKSRWCRACKARRTRSKHMLFMPTQARCPRRLRTFHKFGQRFFFFNLRGAAFPWPPKCVCEGWSQILSSRKLCCNGFKQSCSAMAAKTFVVRVLHHDEDEDVSKTGCRCLSRGMNLANTPFRLLLPSMLDLFCFYYQQYFRL